jgi:hypothetical protein
MSKNYEQHFADLERAERLEAKEREAAAEDAETVDNKRLRWKYEEKLKRVAAELRAPVNISTQLKAALAKRDRGERLTTAEFNLVKDYAEAMRQHVKQLRGGREHSSVNVGDVSIR